MQIETAAPSPDTNKNVPKAILLKDYQQPDYWIPTTQLDFELGDSFTRVRSRLEINRNSASSRSNAPLVLNGEHLKLISVAVNGRVLSNGEYIVTIPQLTIPNVPENFVLEIEVEIEPQKNLACEGLYRSGGENGIFCTQCEAEAFRRITYFLDRPDVMSVFTVTIAADKAKYPILLSNGNLVNRRELGNGRQEVTWHDPHKKPCYLFALVAGNLGVLEDKFTTKSGHEVKLQIFARRGLEPRCEHAMNSLKWAMKWDEDVYGLEYDLDIFMVVVAEDFNMGAMENKGLNVFNANYVLANPETATDHDYNAIMAVVGHEYFHNWTGNRVTCRDWFQLSLKEGLTVFRDQRFTADMTSAAVNRIDEVVRMRTHQFAEDAGPMSHPVRPQSYISIDNFYTLTVYEKGAEVIRMLETLVGRDGFRLGMDLYFDRHDGQAVTTEDFVAAMADANNIDLSQFKNWYDQAGTPVISVKTEYNLGKELFTVTINQRCPPSPGETEKLPFHIPVAVGLLGPGGEDLSLQLESGSHLSSGTGRKTMVLHVREEKQSFIFTGVRQKPVLSLLRGFSAPVRVECDYSDDELAFLIAHDSDSFCQWEAAQTLICRIAKDLVADHQEGVPLRDPKQLTEAFSSLLDDRNVDAAFISLMLALPAEQYIAQFFQIVDVEAIFAAREHMMAALANTHRAWFEETYARLEREGTTGFGPQPSGRRSLKNRALEYLLIGGRTRDLERALQQRRAAKNMTDELGALDALNRVGGPARETAMQEFYAKWKHEPLVMNKWLAIQAISPHADTIDRVRALGNDPVFDKNNPNKIYSLYAAFGRFNQRRFHDLNGAGYRFIADQVLEVDRRNPQVAARLMGAFGQWRTFDDRRQSLMKAEVKRILGQPDMSSNILELASKMLNS
jgi:aminopeptidase N